ncbi:tRNA uridine-5-carboxymethylaminomethyl(34) synthesis GTPase MnmE [Roseovarius sp. SCSIO 43702]|uniref:tRNA uridine-5-carboxymethylaminomethyl(34) synthesis GTPase MnmE n=1 Tax=Roseovarius sp. SCSIO 43702 TaxID=2823043 RepID=UPI001C731408|nr:tRNA uridine-5-carboxymethylaminomethyl(34) synthesis GTPase MnmE [Roseovarius sp. SCSIO 43702]QYX56994.1 tRNA uridine-5-carboxymethylaminomethyl(34) synthesis GTPase MnmE [Roseovarius sp. SCSIO 43702]
MDDTIFALSSAPGKAGVAVVRVSGPSAFTACEALAGRVPEPRRATLCVLRREEDVLDQALVLSFEEGQSFTGEKVVEFQTHGSVATISAICDALSAVPGCRPAEPGEFTRRALENDKLDLAQVEGLADLLNAETEAQRKLALRSFSGELGRKCENWRAKLLRAMALVEVTIDFADEEVPEDVGPEVSDLLQSVISELNTEIDGVGASERIREGFEVAIVGAPNVGKSTLLNRLAGREAAITSSIAGTTRDVIEVRMDVHGLPVTFLDTAGLRESEDVIEGMGIDLARRRAREADLRVFLIEKDIPDPELCEPEDIVVEAKCDKREVPSGISGVTGEGVSELIEKIGSILRSRTMGAGLATRQRHRIAMTEGRDALLKARESLINGSVPSEIVSEDIRRGIHRLDELVGRVDVEAILGEIFSSFCLGK